MPTDAPSPDPHAPSSNGRWLLALLIWAAGAAIIGVAAGWIPSDPGAIRSPRWVLAVAGFAIVAAGFAPLASAGNSTSWASQIAGLGTIGALTLIANWVAFGPGPRHFSGGFVIGGLGFFQGHQSEMSGRIAFGLAALMMDALVLTILSGWARGRKRSERESQ